MIRTGSIAILATVVAVSLRASAEPSSDDGADHRSGHEGSSETRELEPETIVITGTAPTRTAPDARSTARDRARALGETPFVTVLHPDEHAATASVADAIATSAGAAERSLGGLGAFASVSVRGATPGHTQVLVDGVPLARLAQVTVDLGRFAIDSFGEVDLYRGAVPVELGGAGVGGAVNLVTRLGRGERGERIHVSAGGGSYGARHARVHYGDEHGHLRSSTTIGYQGATGDYPYFTDNGTPLDRGDDTTLIRGNNAFDQIDAASRLGDDEGSWASGVRTTWKHQGLPGSIAQPAAVAGISTIDVIADARGDIAIGNARARQIGYALVEHQVLRDPMAELGLGTQDRGYLTLAGGASSIWTRALGHRMRGTAGLELRGERFRDRDLDGGRPDLIGTRAGGAFTAALAIDVGTGIELSPAARVDVVRTAPTPMTEGPDALADLPPRWDAVPSPRLGARVALTPDVAIKASAGWYVRLPTLLELFGDRGLIVGTPDLRAERGPTVDAGVVWAPGEAHGPFDRVLVEAAAFGSRPRDTIALISTAGFVTRAANIGATRSYGAELVGSVRFARTVAVTASYTRLVSEQRAIDPNLDGKTLPRSPGHRLFARADVSHRVLGHAVGGWFDAAAQSRSFLDQANFQSVPGRVLFGTGARVGLGGRLGVTLAVANLADLRVVELPAERAIDSPTPTPLTDVAGYPLPGRSYYLSLDWTY